MLFEVVMVEFEAATILHLLNATDGEFQDFHPIKKYFPLCILSQMSARKGGDSMDIDLSNAWKSGSRIIDLAIFLLPNAILAIVIFIFFLILAAAAKSIVRRISLRRERRQNLGLLLRPTGSRVTLVVLGFLIAFFNCRPVFPCQRPHQNAPGLAASQLVLRSNQHPPKFSRRHSDIDPRAVQVRRFHHGEWPRRNG